VEMADGAAAVMAPVVPWVVSVGGDAVSRNEPTTPRIPTFLSHSYRPEDRPINEHFWHRFWRADFAFTVDPKSTRLSIPHLERMLRYSACFVGVVTLREEQPRYLTSPYLLFEYGLAVLARKPRLVFVERGVSGQYFEDDWTIPFERDHEVGARYDPAEATHAIDRLRQMSIPYSYGGIRLRRSVGLILPEGGFYEEATARVRELLDQAGYRVETVEYLHDRFRTPLEFILEVDKHDFLVIDVGSKEIPPWLHSMLHGRFIPMIRLMHHEAGEQPPPLPPMLQGDVVELMAPGYEMAILWSDVAELVRQLERELQKLTGQRRQFASEAEGVQYFRSLGRVIDAHVFVSNASAQNELAQELCRRLDLHNIRFFHYIFRTDIELGTPWRSVLRTRLERSQIFVSLITRSYLESPVCQEEREVAFELHEKGRLRLFQVLLEDIPSATDRKMELQGLRIAGLSVEEQLEAIVSQIDRYMAPSARASQVPVDEAPWWAETDPEVDVAFVTILQQEYEAVLRLLTRVHRAAATPHRENRYQWMFGEIVPIAAGRPYRVVVGLSGQPGTHVGLEITRDAIETFRPRYVLLVGIAGGIGEARRGDVVVADRIYGYEYGKLHDMFRPRLHWTHPTDTAVTTAAHAMSTIHDDWHRDRVRNRPDRSWAPRIHVGPVASGNKVVDNLSHHSFKSVLDLWPDLIAVEMEGLGAAEAIRDARERHHVVNFAMVRGISDTPLSRPTSLSRQSMERSEGKILASDVAAVLAVEMIRRTWPQAPRV
jgi:nucleoside phosphorylase